MDKSISNYGPNKHLLHPKTLYNSVLIIIISTPSSTDSSLDSWSKEVIQLAQVWEETQFMVLLSKISFIKDSNFREGVFLRWQMLAKIQINLNFLSRLGLANIWIKSIQYLAKLLVIPFIILWGYRVLTLENRIVLWILL